MDLSWILGTLPVGLWVARVPDGAVVYTNPEFQKLLGVDAAPGVTIEGAPSAYGIFDRAGRPYPFERLPFSRVLETGRPVMVDDIVIHRPDGRQVNVRAFGYPAFNGTSALEYVGVAFLDITAEVSAAIERDQTLARLALAVNHAPLVIWSINRLGVITLSEGAGLAAAGLKSGELIGANLFELYKDPTLAGYIRRGLSGESVEYSIQVGDACFNTWLVPIRDAAGAVAGVTALSHDVSQVRKLQATAIQNDRAIALGTLASSVAHEINNPLTYVLGHLEILGEELGVLDAAVSSESGTQGRELSAVAARMREALDTVWTGTERIAGITRELGTFNRPSTDDHAAVEVSAVVRSVLKLVRKQVEARAQLQLDLRETTPVRGNTSRLVQVVLNLVVNAMQALPDHEPGAGRVWISTRNEGQDVVIEVADNGPGVPLADRERIFEPFVTRRDVGKGTGLGLFVCRNIVEGFGGRVSVDERPEGGALFRVVLPAAQELGLAEPVTVLKESEPGSPASGHILIIDDDPAVAKLLKGRLLGAGYQVTVETDASSALERLVAGASFDLIYCDLMMRGMTGMDLADALAERAPAHLTDMLFMTGGAFSPRAQDFRGRHAAQFVDKPFDVVAKTRLRLRQG